MPMIPMMVYRGSYCHNGLNRGKCVFYWGLSLNGEYENPVGVEAVEAVATGALDSSGRSIHSRPTVCRTKEKPNGFYFNTLSSI